MDEYFPNARSYLWRTRNKWGWSWLLGVSVPVFFLFYGTQTWYWTLIFVVLGSLNFVAPLVYVRTYRTIVYPAQVFHLALRVQPMSWDAEWFREWTAILVKAGVPRLLAEMHTPWEEGQDAMKVEYKGE